jgi:hypothetical protein
MHQQQSAGSRQAGSLIQKTRGAQAKTPRGGMIRANQLLSIKNACLLACFLPINENFMQHNPGLEQFPTALSYRPNRPFPWHHRQ